MEKKCGNAGSFSGVKKAEPAVIYDPDKAAVDLFYEKISKLNEPSGLSLVFNFRETMLDLHRFYKEVISRGGFYQVTKMSKWNDIASASNLKSTLSLSAAQLQNVYEMLILQYELIYCPKSPDQSNIRPLTNSQGKRKHCDSSSAPELYGSANKWEHGDDKCLVVTGPLTSPNRSSMVTLSNSNDKECITDTGAPLKPRTGYHIFLRLESQRLKMILGENSRTHNLREMAISAWRSLPEDDKLPYIEASKMDRERYGKEMAAYKQLQENQNVKTRTLYSTKTPSMLNLSTCSEPGDDYQVSLKDSETFRSPDKSNG